MGCGVIPWAAAAGQKLRFTVGAGVALGRSGKIRAAASVVINVGVLLVWNDAIVCFGMNLYLFLLLSSGFGSPIQSQLLPKRRQFPKEVPLTLIGALKPWNPHRGGSQEGKGGTVPIFVLDRLAKFCRWFLYRLHIVLNVTAGVH